MKLSAAAVIFSHSRPLRMLQNAAQGRGTVSLVGLTRGRVLLASFLPSLLVWQLPYSRCSGPCPTSRAGGASAGKQNNKEGALLQKQPLKTHPFLCLVLILTVDKIRTFLSCCGWYLVCFSHLSSATLGSSCGPRWGYHTQKTCSAWWWRHC